MKRTTPVSLLFPIILGVQACTTFCRAILYPLNSYRILSPSSAASPVVGYFDIFSYRHMAKAANRACSSMDPISDIIGFEVAFASYGAMEKIIPSTTIGQYNG